MPETSSIPTEREQLLHRLATLAYRHETSPWPRAARAALRELQTREPERLRPDTINHAVLTVEADAVAVAGLTLGADPLVSGVAMAAADQKRALDALIVRKEAKGHGTGAWLEGPLPSPGALITVLEDVVTTGGSSLKAVRQLRDAGYKVNRVITIVDREEGGDAAMAADALELISLYKLSEIAAVQQA